MSNRRKRKPPPRQDRDKTTPIPDGPFMLACVEMVGRTGCTGFQLRYSDDEAPVVWIAVAEYSSKEPQVAAAITPTHAVFRLLESLVDGGKCTHCEKPTGITAHFAGMPMPETFCWYQFDPELKTFRRGCA